jgi:hypothetical protein
MAQPRDGATTQQLVADVLQEQYLNNFLEQVFFEGNATNRIVELDDEPVVGDGVNIQVKRYKGDNIKVTNDALEDFPDPSAFVPAKIKVRWNEDDPTAHDFSKFHGTGRVSIYEMEEASSDGAIVDIAEEIFDDLRPNYDFKLALFRNLDRTAKVAETPSTGTVKKNNDADNMTDATAYTAGATSCRVVVDNGPIAAFQPGMVYDIYTSGGALVFAGARVTDYNPGDKATGVGSVGFERYDSNSTANFDSVTTSCYFYPSGSRNKGMHGFGSWFSTPTAGESFIGAKDRTLAANRYLTMTKIRKGQTSRKISVTDFDDLGDVVGNVTDKGNGMYTARAHQSIITSLRQQIGADKTIAWPTGNEKMKRFQHMGSMGVHWQHPVLGHVTLAADPLMRANTVQVTRGGDWKAKYRGNKGLKVMPGERGPWYRLQGSTPGGHKSMFYGIDAYANHCDYCIYPKLQGEILNITA